MSKLNEWLIAEKIDNKIQELNSKLGVNISIRKPNSLTMVIVAKHNKIPFGELVCRVDSDGNIIKFSPLPTGIFDMKKVMKIVKEIVM